MELLIPALILVLLLASFLFMVFSKYVLPSRCANCHSTNLVYFRLAGRLRVFCKTCRRYHWLINEDNE